MNHELPFTLSYLIFILFGYLSGSIMYSRILSLKIKHIDICAVSDDGNPGSGNVFKYVSVPMGILCLICDIFKGVIPVALCAHYLPWDYPLFAAVLIAPVLGHSRHGKSIAVSFGVLIGLLPYSMIVFCLVIPFVLFSTLVRIQPHAWRVIISFLCFTVGTFLLSPGAPIGIAAFGISCIVIVKHIQYLRSADVKIHLDWGPDLFHLRQHH